MVAKKYYWLKLKENFFEEDTISWLEEQENGVHYSNFYLKLCLKSLKTNGILVRNVGEILIPYDIKKLAEITHVKLDTAIVAMELFQKIGLVQILDNGEIYLTQLELMVGSETSKAELMRKRREKEKQLELDSGNNVTEMLQNCYTEKEIDINKEKEIQQEKYLSEDVSSNIKVFKHFEKCGFIVTPRLMEFIDADIEIYSSEWLIDAANECVKRGKINNYGYLTGILQNWQTKGRDIQLSNESKTNASAYTQMKSILDE
jgi:predicted phage replisome organizer